MLPCVWIRERLLCCNQSVTELHVRPWALTGTPRQRWAFFAASLACCWTRLCLSPELDGVLSFSPAASQSPSQPLFNSVFLTSSRVLLMLWHNFLSKMIFFETTKGKSSLIYYLQEVCICRCADEKPFWDDRKVLTSKLSVAFANISTNRHTASESILLYCFIN